MKVRFALALIVPALMLGACAAHKDGCTGGECCQEPKGNGAAITSVNEYCPVMPEDPVDPTLTREFNGQKVSFCCKGCVPTWDAMSDAEKDTKLKAAVAKGKVKA